MLKEDEIYDDFVKHELEDDDLIDWLSMDQLSKSQKEDWINSFDNISDLRKLNDSNVNWLFTKYPYRVISSDEILTMIKDIFEFCYKRFKITMLDYNSRGLLSDEEYATSLQIIEQFYNENSQLDSQFRKINMNEKAN